MRARQLSLIEGVFSILHERAPSAAVYVDLPTPPLPGVLLVNVHSAGTRGRVSAGLDMAGSITGPDGNRCGSLRRRRAPDDAKSPLPLSRGDGQCNAEWERRL